jgi:hypothetical protein
MFGVLAWKKQAKTILNRKSENFSNLYILYILYILYTGGLRKLPQTVNNMKIETSISLEMRDEEVEIYGKPNCWDIGRG